LSSKKVLIIGAVWVEPNSSAAGSRMLQLTELFLANNYQVHFATTTQKSENAFDLRSLGVEEYSIQLNDTSFDEFVNELQPSIVVFDRFMIEEQFGWRVAENCPSALRILDTEDLHSLRKVRHEAVKKNNEFSIANLLQSDIAKREIAAILRCDLSLIISTFEMELLQNIFKIDRNIIHHLPFLFDEIDDACQEKWKLFEERKHFVTIGNFLHAPNVDAVLQLKKHIWPTIKKELPEAEIHVYGAYPKQQVLQLHNEKEGFLIKGYVADADEVVSNAKVVLAPIRFGAGIKGKLTEAMLNGTPSVTTSMGAEGMHSNLSWNGFVDDDFEQFSKKAVELYTNKESWEKSQQNGIEIINQLYSKTRLSPLFINRINEIISNLDKHRTANFLGSLLQHQTLQSTKYMSKWIEEKNKKEVR
jgi:glycosyltransferase involved in cell wall biosynthesis